MEINRNRISTEVFRSVYAKYSVVEESVTEFLTFARVQTIPVSIFLMKDRACKTAEENRIVTFSASNDW